MDNKVVTREEIKEFENELKKRWFIIEEPKSIIEIIENLEEFLVADFGQKDWDENFLKRHFKILKDSVKEFQEKNSDTFSKEIIDDNKIYVLFMFSEDVELLFSRWSNLMDKIYGASGEDRHDATMWDENPSRWMMPYNEELYNLWCDWDCGNPCRFQNIEKFVQNLKTFVKTNNKK